LQHFLVLVPVERGLWLPVHRKCYMPIMSTGAALAGRVLVHCAAGVSRSATVVLGYLMSRHEMNLSAAVDHLKAIRPWVCPNAGEDGFEAAAAAPAAFVDVIVAHWHACAWCDQPLAATVSCCILCGHAAARLSHNLCAFNAAGFLKQLEVYHNLAYDMSKWQAWHLVCGEQHQQEQQQQQQQQQWLVIQQVQQQPPPQQQQRLPQVPQHPNQHLQQQQLQHHLVQQQQQDWLQLSDKHQQQQQQQKLCSNIVMHTSSGCNSKSDSKSGTSSSHGDGAPRSEAVAGCSASSSGGCSLMVSCNTRNHFANGSLQPLLSSHAEDHQQQQQQHASEISLMDMERCADPSIAKLKFHSWPSSALQSCLHQQAQEQQQRPLSRPASLGRRVAFATEDGIADMDNSAAATTTAAAAAAEEPGAGGISEEAAVEGAVARMTVD
jgi:hypothetical protein